MKKIVLWSAVAFFCLALPHAGISGEAVHDTASARPIPRLVLPLRMG